MSGRHEIIDTDIEVVYFGEGAMIRGELLRVFFDYFVHKDQILIKHNFDGMMKTYETAFFEEILHYVHGICR